MKQVLKSLPTRLVVLLIVMAVGFVLIAVTLDITTDFGAEYPVTANVVAGVLGLPISGVAVALVVEYLLTLQRRRQWHAVYDHVRTDILPSLRVLLHSIQQCAPGDAENIRERGHHVLEGLTLLAPKAEVRSIVDGDLPADLRASIDTVVALLGEMSGGRVLDSYSALSDVFADLDMLDNPNVKLAILQLRRSTGVFTTFRSGRHIEVVSLTDLRTAGGSWNGDMVERPDGLSRALRVKNLAHVFDSAADVSAAAAELEEKVWNLWFAINEAVEA